MKKNILFIHHSGGLGGAPKSLSYILKNIDKKCYDANLIILQNGPVVKWFQNVGFKPEILKYARPFHGSTVVEPSFRLFLRNLFYFFPTLFQSFRIYNKYQPNIVHLNSTCLFVFAFGIKLISKNTKIICHVREPLRKGFWGFPLRFFVNRYCDGIIAICKNDLDSLKITNSSINITVIYNFTEPQVTINNYRDIRNNLKIKTDEVIFLYLARFAESNGWKNLIRNAVKITEKFNKYHFVLVGAINQDDLFYINHPNIHILKFQDDVNSLFSSSDIFVCPFTEPHFARGIIEAASYGLPSIGANIGGVNELVKQNVTGFLYNSDDEFINYCETLGENISIRNKMSLASLKFSNENFNYEINLKKTLDFIKEF